MTDQVDRPAENISTATDPRMLRTLRTMPEVERRVFLLHAREGLDYAAIADRLGIAVDDVEYHLARALVVLANALDDPLS